MQSLLYVIHSNIKDKLWASAGPGTPPTSPGWGCCHDKGPPTAGTSTSKFFLFPPAITELTYLFQEQEGRKPVLWQRKRQLGKPHRRQLIPRDTCHLHSGFTAAVHARLWPSWSPGSQGTAFSTHSLLRRGRRYKTTAQTATDSMIVRHGRGGQGRQTGIVLFWFTPKHLDKDLSFSSDSLSFTRLAGVDP